MPKYQQIAAIRPDAGIVTIHATMRLAVTAQRTALTSDAAPTPTIEPVMV